ncbi:MAG: magnesium transporter [Clostridium sp.]|nr:magnesium transporter [Clostridium sp.]
MKTEDIFKRLRLLLEERDFISFRREIQEENVMDIADFIADLSDDYAIVAMRLLPKDMSVEVFSEFDSEMKEIFVAKITDKEIDHLLNEMFVDDLVDMIEELPANVVARVLERANPVDRNTINVFLQYPEDSAGSIMTSEYVSLKRETRVIDAINNLRQNGHDSVTLYSLYVIDEKRVLEGVLSLKDLLLAKDDEIVSDLMESVVISAHTHADEEEVSYLFGKYNFMTLPILDSENRLVGIVTVDDIMDVILDRDTEDFSLMSGTLPSEKPYLKTSAWRLARNRMGWLTLLMLSGIITGSILARYEDAFLVLPVLVTFIPMLTDTGGNSGSQSSTLVIRGMVLNEIRLKDAWKVLFKEFQVSMIAGTFLAVITFIRLMFTYSDKPLMVFVVSISILLTVMVAKIVGALLPFFAKIIKADPAIMAAPLITTIVDATSLLIYFTLATMVLGI